MNATTIRMLLIGSKRHLGRLNRAIANGESHLTPQAHEALAETGRLARELKRAEKRAGAGLTELMAFGLL